MKKLKNFRIEESRWQLFQEYCKENNTNASQAILDFIDSCLKDKYQPSIEEYIDKKTIQNSIDNLNKITDEQKEKLSIQQETVNLLKAENLNYKNEIKKIKQEIYFIRFEILNLKQLKDIAKEYEIDFKSKITKSELIDLLITNNVEPY